MTNAQTADVSYFLCDLAFIFRFCHVWNSFSLQLFKAVSDTEMLQWEFLSLHCIIGDWHFFVEFSLSLWYS